MGRELNNELFETPSVTVRDNPGNLSAAGINSFAEGTLPRLEEWKLVLSQVEFLKRRLKEQDAKLEMLASKVQDLVGGAKVRFERLTGAQTRLEDYVKSMLQEAASKFALLGGKLSERKAADVKIQEMIDRHSQLVQGYEMRLSQLQKVSAEQEMQLMTARTELREAQRELARLKRL